jgi:hypothetical protein
MSFTRIAHWPIRDLPAYEDARRPLFWTLAPCTFRNAYDGPGFDAILVRSQRDIFRTHPPGPRWLEVDREREWTLYVREPGEWPASGDQIDPGPCGTQEEATRGATFDE